MLYDGIADRNNLFDTLRKRSMIARGRIIIRKYSNSVDDTREHETARARPGYTGCSGSRVKPVSFTYRRYSLLLGALRKMSLPRETKIP